MPNLAWNARSLKPSSLMGVENLFFSTSGYPYTHSDEKNFYKTITCLCFVARYAMKSYENFTLILILSRVGLNGP